MAIVAVFQGPQLTRQKYEEVAKIITGKSRPESPSDWPVTGLLVHIAGEGSSGFRVVEVWDTEESFRKFGETLLPNLEKAGINVEPDIYPPYALVTA